VAATDKRDCSSGTPGNRAPPATARRAMTRCQARERGGRVGAVVLAAGAATRFGSPKQHLLLPLVLERLAEAAVEEVVVVAGAYPLEAGSARVVSCPDWEAGPGASLRCGLAALPPEAQVAVVVLADGPNLSPEAVDRVLTAWRGGDAPLVAASYNGDRGHPIVVARGLWDSVPDEGLRAFEPVLVPCDDLGAPVDVDRPEDLQ
jgi:CTP:molybdopterin cytidylyltransferase MocA